MLLKVEGGHFVKNTENNALLTVNKSALAENEARKKLAARINYKDVEINSLKQNVDELSNDILEIKKMLVKLISKE